MKGKIAVASLLMASAAVVSCSGGASSDKPAAEKKIAEVGVLKVVSTTDVEGGLGYVGTVKAQKSAKIAARYSGTVGSVKVQPGRHVSAGTVVAEISSPTLESTRATAAATYGYAKDALERVTKVKDAGGVTEQKLIEVRTEHDKALAALQGADQALAECSVKAPFSGVIGEVLVEAGESVTATQPIATIFDISSLEIEISVPEAEMASVEVGEVMDVRIPALGDIHVKAKVTGRGVVASALSHSYSCTLAPIEKVEGMLPGMVCGVKKADLKHALIVVPITAVKTDSEGSYLWTVDNGVAAKRHISTAGYAGDGVIVAEGVEEGDVVITSGIGKVSTGMKVKIREE